MKKSSDSVERRARAAGHVQFGELSQYVRSSMAVLLNENQRNKNHQQGKFAMLGIQFHLLTLSADVEELREQITKARANEQRRNVRECRMSGSS